MSDPLLAPATDAEWRHPSGSDSYAPLRLNAADGHHRFAADVDGIAAQGKCKDRRFGESELARTDENDPLVQTVRGENLLHAAEPHLQREGDMICED